MTTKPAGRPFHRLLIPGLALVAGLLLAFQPLFVSGFRRVPGGGDTRLVGFSLEHSYRHLQQREPHLSFWDPPIFHPARNVAAYTDTLLSTAPLYWLWRALGLAPDSAFQLWLLAVGALNFLAFYLLLRRIFGLGEPAAAAGAFVFAFGSSRVANIAHPQLVPGFFLAIALYALYRAFETDGALAERTRRRWIVTFFVALAVQAWTAFYPFFFFVFLTGLALVPALLLGRSRRRLATVLRRSWPAAVLGAVLALALLAPLAAHYDLAADTLGLRRWDQLVRYQPRWQSWLLMGTTHFASGWVYGTDLIAGQGSLHTPSHANGLGLLTPVLAAIGLYRYRRKVSVPLLALTALLMVLLTTVFPGGFTFWRLAFEHLPGAGAVRALGRIGQLLLIPAGLGVGLFFESRARQRLWPAAVLALLVVFEQVHLPISYDKVEARQRVETIARGLEPHCRSFMVSATGTEPYPGLQEDAMWAALRTGVPTINGRYGNFPPKWRLFRAGHHRHTRDRAVLEETLGSWIERNCLDADKVCWIQVEAPVAPTQGWIARRVAVPDRACVDSRG